MAAVETMLVPLPSTCPTSTCASPSALMEKTSLALRLSLQHLNYSSADFAFWPSRATLAGSLFSLTVRPPLRPFVADVELGRTDFSLSLTGLQHIGAAFLAGNLTLELLLKRNVTGTALLMPRHVLVCSAVGATLQGVAAEGRNPIRSSPGVIFSNFSV